ncbi:MAG: hypothetical protein ABEJ75_03815 [Candidatus Nanohaloarchaea archaeon]
MAEEVDTQQALQIFERRLNDIQLTVHALLSVLEEKDMVDQDTINDKAQEIVEEIEEQQDQPGDLEDQLE